jgi:hypothetical protein
MEEPNPLKVPPLRVLSADNFLLEKTGNVTDDKSATVIRVEFGFQQPSGENNWLQTKALLVVCPSCIFIQLKGNYKGLVRVFFYRVKI